MIFLMSARGLERTVPREHIHTARAQSRSYVTNSRGLLKLGPFLQACLVTEKLTVSYTRLINTLPDAIPKYRVADITIDWN